MRFYGVVLIVFFCGALCTACATKDPGIAQATAGTIPDETLSTEDTMEENQMAEDSNSGETLPNTAKEESIDNENADREADANTTVIDGNETEETNGEGISDNEADSGESDNTEADSGELDNAEADSGESDNAEIDSGESDNAEADSSESDNAEASNAAAATEPAWPEGLRDPYPAQYQTQAGEGTLSNKMMGWYYNRNSEHQPPTAQNVFDIRPYDAYYLGDITQKTVYLTFDEGYEYGFTEQILDVLKEKEVPAAFFMTQTYIRDNPELSARIAAEGHVAANHSVRHKSSPDLTDEELAYELNETARYYQEITGYDMSLYFRPPMGEYSMRTLATTQALGYKSFFWSFAHEDWLVDKQPSKETTYTRVMDSLHNGEIFLLHAVSKSNTEALPDIIDAIRAQGYTFGRLDDFNK